MGEALRVGQRLVRVTAELTGARPRVEGSVSALELVRRSPPGDTACHVTVSVPGEAEPDATWAEDVGVVPSVGVGSWRVAVWCLPGDADRVEAGALAALASVRVRCALRCLREARALGGVAAEDMRELSVVLGAAIITAQQGQGAAAGPWEDVVEGAVFPPGRYVVQLVWLDGDFADARPVYELVVLDELSDIGGMEATWRFRGLRARRVARVVDAPGGPGAARVSVVCPGAAGRWMSARWCHPEVDGPYLVRAEEVPNPDGTRWLYRVAYWEGDHWSIPWGDASRWRVLEWAIIERPGGLP